MGTHDAEFGSQRVYIILQVVIAPCDSRFVVVNIVMYIKVSICKVTLGIITAKTRLDELKN